MRTRHLVTGALFVASVVANSSCFIAPSTPPTLDLTVDVATLHDHRGMVQNEKGVVQTSMNAGLETKDGGGLNLNVWGNIDMSNDTGDAWLPNGHGGRFSEIDLSVTYVRSHNGFDFAGGILTYVAPNGLEFPFGERGGTTELFARVGHLTVWDLYPSLTLHYDYDEVEDIYLNGSVERGFQVDEDKSVVASVSLGYSGEDHSLWAYDVDASGFADLQARVTGRWMVDERTEVHAGLAASTIVDSDIEEWFEFLNIESENVWAHIGVTWFF